MDVKFHIVVVTYNRSSLLRKCLLSIFAGNRGCLSKVIVVDNASSDDTPAIMENFTKLFPNYIQYVRLSENLGGSGGFYIGSKIAYNDGAEWIGLIDDDVLLGKECLSQLHTYVDQYECLIAVREDSEGNLAEYAAIKYDLSNPLLINPKTMTPVSLYKERKNIPDVFEIEAGSFEGFFISRRLMGEIGYPHPEYFIYSDDFDYSLRCRRAGFKIAAVRDAIIVRQLPYVRNTFNSWKTYYVWRNFFILHFLYGENIFVKAKPYFMSVALLGYSILKFKPINSFKILNEARKIAQKIKGKHNHAE